MIRKRSRNKMSEISSKFTLTVTENGQRLDAFLAENTNLSRSRATALIEKDLVWVNEKKVPKKYKLNCGDLVEFLYEEQEAIDAKPENIPLNIVYEDSDLLIINKPQGMVVHPAPGNYTGTLVNALLYHCTDLSGINGKLRPGIVHRIDKDTSGLLVVAKNDTSHTALSEMFQQHNFTRKYHAIVYGNLREDAGTISLAIGRSKSDRKKMAFYPPDFPNAKNAVTHYRVLERFHGYTYVELSLETGRTHQIRVHMLSISSPVLADPLYAPNRETFGLSGQCLHAKYIEFKHPVTHEKLVFDSPLPDYFESILNKLRLMS